MCVLAVVRPGGVSLGISDNGFTIRISRNVEIPPRGQQYIGCLVGDRLPIGAAKLRPEGVLYGPFRALRKALGA